MTYLPQTFHTKENMKTPVATFGDVDSILRVGMQSLLELFDDSFEGTIAVDDQGRIVWIKVKYGHFPVFSGPD